MNKNQSDDQLKLRKEHSDWRMLMVQLLLLVCNF